jgi:deoxyribonuclease V
MNIPNLHTWPKDAKEALALQKRLAPRIVLKPRSLEPLTLIAGVDVSSVRARGKLWASAVVLRYPEMEVVEEAYETSTTEFPYIPGLLSFREIPILIETMRKLRHPPDAVLCDGQGLAHPRLFGLACHLGLWLNLPTVGCAKTRLVGDTAEPGYRFGDWQALKYQEQTVGAVVRTRSGCKPIYVSPGHLIDAQTARALVLATCKGLRLPEPTRLAHLFVNRYRKGAGETS